jgi:lysozyme family protein
VGAADQAVTGTSSDVNDMFKKHTPLQWILFCVVLAMIVVLFWLAQYLEKASF